MNKILVSCLFFFLLLDICAREGVAGKSFFSTRSQGVNSARDLLSLSCSETLNSYISVVPEYTKSFYEEHIGTYFFFNGLNSMKFSNSIGSGGDLDTDVAAYNFGLGNNFKGKVTAYPRKENLIVDFNWFSFINKSNFWLKISAPFVWTRQKMNINENIECRGENFLPGQVATKSNGFIYQANNSIIEAWKGEGRYGDMQVPFKYGKIDDGKNNSKAGLADIAVWLGYKIHSSFNIKLLAAVPTGNKPKAEYIFEPIIGNNGHWEFGCGYYGKVPLLNSDSWRLDVFIDANLTHLFENMQKRSFDFKNHGRGSRYLLLKEFDDSYVYNKRLINAINITTLDTRVASDVQIDLSLFARVKKDNLKIGLGYNFWGKSKEKLKIKEKMINNKYSFLGIVGLEGSSFPGAGAGYLNTNNINNRVSPLIMINGFHSNSFPISDYFVIKESDLDINSAASPTMYSHKIFIDFTYGRYLGFGGMLEFTAKQNRAITQWGVFGKSSVEF